MIYKMELPQSMSEVGHTKNVANFATLLTFATNLGAAYKPSRDELKIFNLNALLNAAQTALAEVGNQLTAWKDATNQRETAFAPLKPMPPRLLNALTVAGADQLTCDDAKSLVNKLLGRRASAKPEAPPAAVPDAPAPRTRSSAQVSFDNRVENFDLLIKLLAGQTAYAPNETELQTATLNTMLADMRAKNTAAVSAANSLSNARLARNQTLYHSDNALVKTAAHIKLYIKAVFGPNSPQAKQISGLRFTTL
jgi:hypothetical protein